MSFEDRIRDVVHHAELDLRELLKQAIEAGDYGAVARIAEVAGSIADMAGDGWAAPAVELTLSSPPRDAEPEKPEANGVPVPRRPRVKRPYPRFERDGDKMIKVGWSKKDGCEYEHRAPIEAITLTARRLSETAGVLFTMDEILPISNEDGEEIPSYQVYLAVAWFRGLGVVVKKGKTGYVIQNGALEWESLKAEWDNITDKW
jgi:hypothetical protein